MSAEIVKLVPNEVGEDYRFPADQILEGAKSQNFTNLVIVGETEGGEDIYIAGMANAGEALILMERAKLQLIGAL